MVYLCTVKKIMNIMNSKKVISFVLFLFLGLPQLLLAQHRASYLAGYDDGISGKWEVRIDLGGLYGTKSDMAAIVDLGGGYNINSNLYFGLATGIFPGFGVVDYLKSDAVIPLLADVTGRLNTDAETFSTFLQLRGGYLLHTNSSDYLERGEGSELYERKGYAVFEVNPGFYLRIRRNIDLRMSMGYTLAVPGNDGHSPSLNCTEHLFNARVGINYRGTPTTGSRAELKAEASRIAREESERQYNERMAQQRARDEEARRKASEAREQRRREREGIALPVHEEVTQSSAVPEEVPVEFYCHVTPAMIDENTYDKLLVQLAGLAASKSVSSIVVLGCSNPGSTDVTEAITRAETVYNILSRRYVINKDLLSSVTYGFESSSSPSTRPKDAIATIMIHRVVK